MRTHDAAAHALSPAAAPRDGGAERSEPMALGSPRTPSPILGGGRAAADAEPTTTPGHLTFPQVGLGTMEQEMQLLTSMEDVDEADEPWDHDTDTLVAEAHEQLTNTDRDAPLAHTAHRLVERVQQQQASRAHLKHLARVTRLASLSLLSSLRISYSHMLHAERDINSRLEVELNGSKSQSRMLSDMVSRASLTQHDDERRAVAHKESADDEARHTSPTSPAVAERNKLLADKRYLRQRVHDAEAQVARLEAELQSLRPMLLRHSQEEAAGPPAPTRTPRTPRRQREAVMGDAKSEHLLLAARMLRTLRHAARPPPVPSPGAMATDSSPSQYKTDTLDAPHTPRSRDGRYPTTPKTAAVRPRIVTEEVPPSVRSETSAPLSGIDELLHAAQSLRGSEPAPATSSPHRSIPGSDAPYLDSSPPVHASPVRMWPSAPVPSAPVFGSPKRRRVSSSQMDVDEDMRTYVPRTAGDAPAPTHDGLSALDVLADQAAAHEAPDAPRTPYDSAHRRTQSSHSPLEQRSWTPVAAKPTSASASKPRTVGGNQSPEKRLPYVRWSAEEDTKLRRAIKEHGQRWEHVARAVGTRSYHQCRQRYLLMRRKEAAANGLASPSKSSAPGQASTPSRVPARPTHAAHPTPFMNEPHVPQRSGEEEQGSSSGSSSSGAYDPEGARPRPMLAQPSFASPARYERPVQHLPHHPTTSPQSFPHRRVGPVLYS